LIFKNMLYTLEHVVTVYVENPGTWTRIYHDID